ncbi:MAG: tyrosine-type recombinase/integrase [Acidobacteriota bacterium]|nr:tyrosine-type recombinase/integrase [Acidobacteriota bacterium]
MRDERLILKSKLNAQERRIIAMVIDGLPSENSRRAYERALKEFFIWHASENRPELNKALINRYVKSLREQKLSSSTINQKLSAIRKLATEAEDNNLIDSRLANGIRAVRGVPFRGRRTGNWLTKEDAQAWLDAPDVKTLKGVRDRALLAILIGCGLRRAEAAILSFHHIEQREGRWAIVDIVGKRDKMRTVPMPSWAKACVDSWKTVAHLEEGFIFRRVNKGGNLMGESITPQAVRDIVNGYAQKLENQGIAPHDLRRTFAKLAHKGGSPIDQIQLSLGHDSIQTTEKYLGVEQDLTDAPCDHLGLKLK